MAYQLIPNIRARYFNANGGPLAGGKVFTYVAGSVTAIASYQDNSGTPNTNPVILDANGEASIYFNEGTYKVVLKDSADVIQWTGDNIVVPYDAAGTGSGDASAWIAHAVTDGQAAADLSTQTVNLASYSSAFYSCEIIRGSTVFSSFTFAIQSLAGVGRIALGVSLSDESHGVTLSLSQTLTVVQLRAALDSGAGNGTIKLSRRLIPV